MWDNCNHILHNSQTLAKLQEKAVLDKFIADQFTLGPNALLRANLLWLSPNYLFLALLLLLLWEVEVWIISKLEKVT